MAPSPAPVPSPAASPSAVLLPQVPALIAADGTPRARSTDVAEFFGKRHDHVIRDIDNLRAQLPAAFCLSNFGETEIERPSPLQGTIRTRAFLMTRDGFTLLAMGFTGKKALLFKLAYIEAFNRMEEELRSRAGAAATMELLDLGPYAKTRDYVKALYTLVATNVKAPAAPASTVPATVPAAAPTAPAVPATIPARPKAMADEKTFSNYQRFMADFMPTDLLVDLAEQFDRSWNKVLGNEVRGFVRALQARGILGGSAAPVQVGASGTFTRVVFDIGAGAGN